MRAVARRMIPPVLVILAVVGSGGVLSRAQVPPPGPRLIRITMEPYRFTPATIFLKAKEPIRLELQNLGSERHQFRSTIFKGVDVWVRTPGYDVLTERFDMVAVRASAIATIEFVRRTPGQYEFWCGETVDGRPMRDLGMLGKFIVTE